LISATVKNSINEAENNIDSELVVLRPFCEEFITQRYLSWFEDEEILRFSNQRFKEHSAQSSLAYLKSFDNTANLFFAIFTKAETPEMIGTMTAYVSKNHSTADIGILIGERSSWGKGFGASAWITLMNYLFQTHSMRKITGGTLAENYGMLSIFKRANMQPDGVRKQQEIANGKLQDVLYFARFGNE